MSGCSLPTGAFNKALYGNLDPRKNLYELDALDASEKQDLYPDLADIKANAAATACLIHKSMLPENLAADSYSLSTTTTLSSYIKQKFKYPLSDGEKFGNECCTSYGSGFLVGRKKLMTAGHNLKVNFVNFKDIRIIFNLCIESNTSFRKKYAKTQVYHIKRVIHDEYDPNNKKLPDWALLKLDRVVEGIEPMKIQCAVPKEGHRVYMLSYPMGLPLKFSGVAHVKKTTDAHKFESDLAAFTGDSGAPVIDRITHEVVGILVHGHKDYDVDPGQSVVIAYHVTDREKEPCGYELCQKITPEMLDVHLIIAKEGRTKRKMLSDRKSEAFEQSMLAQVNLSKQFLVRIFPFRTPRFNPEEFEEIQKYKEDFKREINFLEAKNMKELSVNKSASKEEQIALVRCMSAYCLSEEQAVKIKILEIDCFKERFSPDKILDLLRVQNDNPNLCNFKIAKRFLKYLQKKDPKNLSVDTGTSQSQVVTAIKKATEKSAKKLLKSNLFSDQRLEL